MSDFVTLQNRVMDETLRGGDGNRTQIKAHINEAIKMVDALLRPKTLSVTKTLVAAQQNYSIVTDFLITDLTSIRDILYSSITLGTSRPLEETTAAMIREMRLTPTFSNYVSMYALDGLDLLLLFPTTQNVGDTVTIYYTSRPVDLVNDADIPVGIPPEFHELYEIAAIQSAMRVSMGPDEAMKYSALFDKKLNDYRKWRNHHTGTLARKAMVGRYGRRIQPHDPSTDMGY